MQSNDHQPSEEPARAISVDTVLGAPLVKVVMFATALLSTGWVARQSMDEINKSVVQLGVSLENIRQEVGRLRVELREEIHRRTQDQWTRTDQKFWSYELHKANAGQLHVPAVPAAPATTP